MIDARAKKILFDTYWSPKGWIDDRLRTTKPDDLAYAREKGVMFEPLTIDHDGLVERLIAARSALTLAQVSGAFLASLSTRRLDWRSGLASWCLSDELSPHAFSGDGQAWCSECGANERYEDYDLDVLSFERLKWGGVRRGNPLYHWLDLSLLARDLPAAPAVDDLEIFDLILRAIDRAPAAESPTKLSKRLADALPSTKAERDCVLEILAAIGVLVAKKERGGWGDWDYVGGWRGEDRYDAAAVQRIFGMHLGKKKPRARKA